jgi:uncharacterized protein (TIGR02145 family)
MKENLNIGEMIPATMQQTDNATIEKYCYYDEPDSCTKYGGLYQWEEMMQYTNQQGAQSICPPGWHIPSDAEWDTLANYLGGSDLAGGKMKEAGTSHWNSPNVGATNSSGFTALPGGYRYPDDWHSWFSHLGGGGGWWSSTEKDSTSSWRLYLYHDFEGIYRLSYSKNWGYSVRCLKD